MAAPPSTAALLGSLLVLLVLQLSPCASFNLETEHYTRHVAPGQRPAMFGFAVTAHKERGQPWVMVGAPEAQSRQPGVTRGGSVYRCDPTRDDACAEVVFDPSGSIDKMEQKSYQWFGATLNSAGEDGPVVACAPRYVSYAARSDRRDPVGTCYVAKNGFSDIKEYSPCRTRNWGYHRQGSCQAGLGAALSKDGRRLFVGAPGSWYWQGQLYSINPLARMPYLPPRYKEYGEGQLYSQDQEIRDAVFFTGESIPMDDDSYLGYSVAVGDFSGSGQQGVAVGMPRGAELLGKVVLYSWDLRNLQNLTGEQIGGYFGYSLCSSDVDGDGLDDLIVGAPMYTVPNNDGSYEAGRVYIIYQNSQQGLFQRVEFRDGSMSRSRFGLSLASLGDINLDGFGDFAVGAPYAGASGRGAVYIYHGGQGGVRELPSQVIMAEDINAGSLRTFGFSVSGGVDLDDNKYSDLVVGAYDSDTAFFFRAKPVVKMTASILFGTEAKLISLDEKNCTLYNREKVACTTINYCLKYDGINVDQEVEFDLQFVLDSKKTNSPRLFFLDQEGRHTLNHSIPLVRDRMYCNSMPVYIAPNIRDKLTSLEASVTYGMRSEASSSGLETRRQRNPRSALRAVLDQNTLNTQKDSINIQKNCGRDNICIPDLRLMATPSVDKFLLGSKDPLTIDVIVQNMGEDAFEATYSVVLPNGVNYVKIERVDKAASEIPVQCSPPTAYNNNTLKCDIGNPLPQGRLVHFKVLLEPYHKTGMAPTYDFYMAANSTNPEIGGSTADNEQKMSIAIWLETDLKVTAVSLPPDLHYNASLYKESNFTHETDIGPQLVHKYGIANNGPSTIEEVEIFVLWPYETLAGDSMMYLLEQPETMGNIKCELAEHVNDFNLQVDHRKTYLDSKSTSQAGLTGSAHGGGLTAAAGSGMATGTGGKKILTEAERRRIDEEERKFGSATGDGSSIHIQRSQSAQGSQNSYSMTQNKQWSSTTQSGSTGGGTVAEDGTRIIGAGEGGTVILKNTSVTYYGTDGRQIAGSQTGGRQGGGSQSTTVINQGSSAERAKQNWDAIPPEGRTTYSNERSGTTWSGNQKQGVTATTWTTNQQGGGAGQQSETSTKWTTTQQGAGGQYGAGRQGGSQTATTWTVQNTFQPGGVLAAEQGGKRVYTQGNTGVVQGREGEGRVQWTGDGQWSGHPAVGVGGFNRTYTRTWNSTQVDGGPAVVYHSSKNVTSVLGPEGNVQRSESSTEYYTHGAEGETGASFNNRFGEGANSNTTFSRTTSYHRESGSRQDLQGGAQGARGGSQGTWRQTSSGGEQAGAQGASQGTWRYASSGEQGQGGSTKYEAGSYTSGARRPSGDHRYSSGYNVTWGGDSGHDRSFSSGGARHKWSTEETVNQDLVNAGSQTFQAGNTFMGAPQSGGAMGAAAAGRGYRVNTWDVTGATGGSAASSQLEVKGPSARVQDGARSYESSSYQTQQWSSKDRDNVPTGSPEHFRWDRGARGRRSPAEEDGVLPEGPPEDINEQQLLDATRCPGLKCARMRCVAGPLHNNDEVWVALRTRVNAQTLKKLSFGRSISLTTVAAARVSRLPYLGSPLERPPHAQQAVSVLTPLAAPQEAGGVPLWVVVLAACAGALLLLLLILALYKCGFFKRNRPSDAPERQPLNRNGYGHGDEQL